ncbi:MAG: DUF4258 domain-containing protein [Pseudohongiella sp.]|nr:DUF4258 domain-containing protein [Pseudohongiella sp.]
MIVLWLDVKTGFLFRYECTLTIHSQPIIIMGMTNPTPIPAINKYTVARAIKAAAEQSENIIITNHAKQRMIERGITRSEVNRCLRHGQQQGKGFINDKSNWQVELLHTVAGRRLAVQAVLIEEERRTVIVVTTWRIL